MLTREFDYELPPELIAQEPPAERGLSRMMVLPICFSIKGENSAWVTSPRSGKPSANASGARHRKKIKALNRMSSMIAALLLEKIGDEFALDAF